jgi:defect-in-organelle-trafficking protein DotA
MVSIVCNQEKEKSMIKKLLLGIFCYLVCSEAFAYIFTVSPTDMSQQYLGLIFGSTVGAINLIAASNNVTLSLMFQNFNFIIVTIGAVVLGYLAVISTVNTAREGKAMGEKISMWVPLRALFGMLMMVPGPSSGYSVVQMTVLWIVLNGIGAANSVWNVVAAELSQGIGIQGAQVQLPSTSQPTVLVQGVLYANTCLHSINNMTDLLQGPGPLTQYGPVSVYPVLGPAPKQPTVDPTNPNHLTLTQTASVNIGLAGQGAPAALTTLCGQLNLSVTLDNMVTGNNGAPGNTFNFATLAQTMTVKIAAVQAMFNVLDPAAQALASTATGAQYAPPDPGYLNAAVQAYTGQIVPIAVVGGMQVSAGANAASWATNPVAAGNAVTGAYQQLQQAGWIHAGSFYYTMVSATSPKIDSSAISLPTTSNIPLPMNNFAAGQQVPASWTTVNGSTNTAITSLLDSTHLGQLNMGLKNVAQYVLQQASYTPNPQLTPQAISTGNATLDGLVQFIENNIQTPIITGIQNMMTGTNNNSGNYQPLTFTQDPLVSMAQFGSGLMWAAEGATLGIIALGFLLTLAGSVVSCISPLPFALITLVGQITLPMFMAFGLLWTAGATFGIYAPLIPYLVFTTSAFSWMIAVIEAMVGAPLIALGLVHPSGEELGKAESALVILANVFLRPTLMVFGFVLGASLLRAGIALVNYGFLPALISSTIPSMLSILVVLGLYTGLIVSMISQSFSLIYLLPNQIMRWMGGQAESSDPSNMVKDAKASGDTMAKEGGQKGIEAGQKQGQETISQAKEKRTADKNPKPKS